MNYAIVSVGLVPSRFLYEYVELEVDGDVVILFI